MSTEMRTNTSLSVKQREDRIVSLGLPKGVLIASKFIKVKNMDKDRLVSYIKEKFEARGAKVEFFDYVDVDLLFETLVQYGSLYEFFISDTCYDVLYGVRKLFTSVDVEKGGFDFLKG